MVETYNLTPELLLRAYAVGLFPMSYPSDSPDLFWLDPEVRGILPLDRFHVPRRLRRTVRTGGFEIRCDTAFNTVIAACAESCHDRPSTWINSTIMDLYIRLHEMGRAHSVEVYLDGEIVGGLYGVSLCGAFFGESMFSRRRDTSKVALVHLVARLRKSGYRLLDTQFVTDHLVQFGVREVPRGIYRQLLSEALDHPVTFNPCLSHSDLLAFLQSTSQMSYTGCSRADTDGLDANIHPENS